MTRALQSLWSITVSRVRARPVYIDPFVRCLSLRSNAKNSASSVSKTWKRCTLTVIGFGLLFASPMLAQDDIGSDLLTLTEGAETTETRVPQTAPETPVDTTLQDTVETDIQDAPLTPSAATQTLPPEPTVAIIPPQEGETPPIESATTPSPPVANTSDPIDTTALSESSADTLRTLLTRLWQDAVRTGQTTLGFDDWIAETLQTPPEEPDTQDTRTRAASERWLTRTGPVALGEAGRVVAVFGSAIPTALCSPVTVCTILLEPGETLTDTPSWGDTVRWQVVPKMQGKDTVLFEVKPAEDARVTNLVIPTDRRLYTIRLVNDADVHTPILAFSYPDTAEREAREAIARRKAEDIATEEARAAAEQTARELRAAELNRSGLETDAGQVPASDLDFAFRFDGRAAFRPVRVFTDGKRTYIDLSPRYRGALPAIVAGPGEANAALNTRVAENGTRLIADRIITDIWLQSGKARVRIRKTGS